MFYFVNDPFILQIDTTFETYDKFFNLNIDVKRKYTKKTGTTKNGWDELERERYTYFIIYLYGRKFFQPFTTMRNPKGTDLSVCILEMSDDTVIEVGLN